MIWHQDTELPELDLIAVPGGFSYGDYLRCGAMAAHSPVMQEVKRRVDKGVRVLMIIDAPDDLEQLMSPPGLKEAMKYADGVYAKTKKVQVVSDAGTDITWQCGEYPVMTQWGYADEPGHFDHWGGGHIHTFPNEGSATGTVIIQPGDIIILPYCRYVTDPVKVEVREGRITKIDGGRYHIGVMRPDGSGERLLTESYFEEGPTWAPNGRVLMFYRQAPRGNDGSGGKTQLWSIDLTGYNERVVLTPVDASDPAWSPLLPTAPGR